MSELIKHMAARFPGPFKPGRHMRRTGLETVFPFYHAVSDMPLPHMKHLYALRSIGQFEKDLDDMLKLFTPVSMEEFMRGESPRDTGRPRMVLSFDDGLAQCYQDIRPILLKKGVPAIFFLNNDFIDNRALFYRYKVSLLLELLPARSEQERRIAAEILHCPLAEIHKRLLSLSYAEREMCDHLAEAWNYSFADYMSRTPVYLSTQQIQRMKEEGFEFGSHGMDHLLFSALSSGETFDHVRRSVADLQERFGLDHKYFAFPFTDHGVKDSTIEGLLKEGIIEAGFGTAGLKEDRWPDYYQRIPMEGMGLNARRTIKGELNRRRMRRVSGRNMVNRGGEKCRVNTLIIGAGRSGTTSLFSYLKAHPEVCFSKIKEVHYFSIEELHRRGEAYYHSFFSKCQGETVLAAADTYLLMDYEAIERIHAYNPDMKIIVMLRDPVSRAYSSYNYSVNYGHHKAYASFLDSIEKEKDMAGEPDIVLRNNRGHFYGSLYYKHLKKWLELFPREQLCLLKTSWLKEDPQQFTAVLFSFLKLSDFQGGIERANAAAVPKNKQVEQFFLNRDHPLRRMIRGLTPRFLKNLIMGTGMVDKLHEANRKEQLVTPLSHEEEEKAKEWFREDLQGMADELNIRF